MLSMFTMVTLYLTSSPLMGTHSTKYRKVAKVYERQQARPTRHGVIGYKLKGKRSKSFVVIRLNPPHLLYLVKPRHLKGYP